MAGIEHTHVEVNGLRLHCASAGSGPLMLFVHGFPEFWYAWRRQLEAFSADHLAVAPDLRGYNLSDKPAEVRAYATKPVVEDLCRLIDHFGGRPCVLIGHDWGGAAAWALAAQRPEYVAKLVIINSPHPLAFVRELTHNEAQRKASAYMLMFRDARAEALLAENDYQRLADIMGAWAGGTPLSPEDLAAYRQAWSQPGALTGGLNYYRAMPAHPPTEGAPGAAGLKLDPAQHRVEVPTLVIWGERDKALLPCLLDGLEEWVSDLRVERIPEASHWVVREQPERVNALIRAFIEER